MDNHICDNCIISHWESNLVVLEQKAVVVHCSCRGILSAPVEKCKYKKDNKNGNTKEK